MSKDIASILKSYKTWFNIALLILSAVMLYSELLMLFVRGFTSCQHLRSNQNGYRLVIVHTHSDIIVLPPLEARLLTPTLPFPTLSYIPDTELISPCPILVMLSTRLGTINYWSPWFDLAGFWTPILLDRKSVLFQIWPPHPVETDHIEVTKRYVFFLNKYFSKIK